MAGVNTQVWCSLSQSSKGTCWLSPTWILKGLNVLGAHIGDWGKGEETPICSSKTLLAGYVTLCDISHQNAEEPTTHWEYICRLFQTPAHRTVQLPNDGYALSGWPLQPLSSNRLNGPPQSPLLLRFPPPRRQVLSSLSHSTSHPVLTTFRNLSCKAALLPLPLPLPLPPRATPASPLSPWKEAGSSVHVHNQPQIAGVCVMSSPALCSISCSKIPHGFLKLRKYPVRGPLPISVSTSEALLTCKYHPLFHGVADMGWHKTSLIPFKSLFFFTQAGDRWWGSVTEPSLLPFGYLDRCGWHLIWQCVFSVLGLQPIF